MRLAMSNHKPQRGVLPAIHSTADSVAGVAASLLGGGALGAWLSTFGRHMSQRKGRKELLRGGKADGEKPNQFNPVELRHGISVEKEHTSSTQKAKEIAMDHLTEHPNYYNALKKMEDKLKKSEKKAGGTMSRLDTYLAWKSAADEEKKKESEGSSSDKKEDSKEQAPPQQEAAPPPVPPGMPPMAAAMPTPMSPVDVMGQGIQQTTQGVNQIIDAFYALQGGAPSAAPPPSAAPQASAIPGDPTGQGTTPAPAGPVQAAASTGQQPLPQQKSAGQMVPGGYTCSDSSSGARYYQMLRNRVAYSNSITGGGAAPKQG